MVVFVKCSCNVVDMLVVMEIRTSVSVLAHHVYYIRRVCFQIPHGGRYGKEYILKTLLASVAPTVFIPLNVSSLSFVHYVTANQCFIKIVSL
jgi:hypothetical protein